MNDIDKYIQRSEAAKLLGVSPQTVDRYRLAGYFKSIRYGGIGRHRYSLVDILAFKNGTK